MRQHERLLLVQAGHLPEHGAPMCGQRAGGARRRDCASVLRRRGVRWRGAKEGTEEGAREGTAERQGAAEARALAKTETMSATVIMPFCDLSNL